jgi:copper chaperone CopZ
MMFRLIPHRALIEPRAAVIRTEPTNGGSTTTLRIDGLLCSACAANVRGRLERVPGVRSARVDLETGEAAVECDPALATPEALVAAVESAVILRPLRRFLARFGHPARRGAVKA